MRTSILTFFLLFNIAIVYAQVEFDNKRTEYPFMNEDIADANPHLFIDDPFYGYEHYSFKYNKREIFSDITVNNKHIPNGYFLFWLSLHEGKELYQIDLREIHGDSIQDRLISYGKLQKKGEKYFFTDKMNGSRLEAKLQYVYYWGNVILFNKSYPHFKRKAFEWGGHPFIETVNKQINIEYFSSIFQSNKLKLPIRKQTIGSYQSADNDLFLLLNPDTTYRYYVCGLLLSEGTWTQKGQRIELYDKHLQHTFYGKITNQGILSGYWPGDMEGTLLKRAEK